MYNSFSLNLATILYHYRNTSKFYDRYIIINDYFIISIFIIGWKGKTEVIRSLSCMHPWSPCKTPIVVAEVSIIHPVCLMKVEIN